ncbi:MAG TPA: hypothetical protein V6C72_14880 [Chroococcales cyanobacterium]
MNENDAKKLYDRATNAVQDANEPVVHVRVAGRSRDVALSVLNLSATSGDAAVKDALARFMELSPADFSGAVVERHENGNLTVRPEAVYG